MKVWFLLALLLGAPACAPPISLQTPAGRAAWTADQIVLRVNELENAAIQANATGGFPTAATRVIVEFTVSADKVLKSTPQGWRATVTTAWTQAQRQFPPSVYNNPAVQAAITAVNVVLATAGDQ